MDGKDQNYRAYGDILISIGGSSIESILRAIGPEARLSCFDLSISNDQPAAILGGLSLWSRGTPINVLNARRRKDYILVQGAGQRDGGVAGRAVVGWPSWCSIDAMGQGGGRGGPVSKTLSRHWTRPSGKHTRIRRRMHPIPRYHLEK